MSAVILIVFFLHLIAAGIYWFLIHLPYNELKARLNRLERSKATIQDSNHHHNHATHQIYDEMTRVKNKKRLKREQKKYLQHLYLVVAVPISAGIIILAYIIELFLK